MKDGKTFFDLIGEHIKHMESHEKYYLILSVFIVESEKYLSRHIIIRKGKLCCNYQ